MKLQVYLSGEIHSDWRQKIMNQAREKNLPVQFSAPVTDHAKSDNVGSDILGDEEKKFWKDHKAAGINSIRIQNSIENADLIIVKFGEEYRQWNAAFDAGFAAARQIPIITLHPEELNHALKEIDSAAKAVARTPEQVVEILEYITRAL
jgi:YtoQ family protein